MRSAWRRVALLVLLAACGGCVWVQNEFFVYSRVSPDLKAQPPDVLEPAR